MIEKAIFFVIILTVMAIIIAVIINLSIQNSELKQYKIDREREYYKHKNYECKRYTEYLLSPQEKLNKIFSSLPGEEQQKIVNFAENVYHRYENSKYNKK